MVPLFATALLVLIYGAVAIANPVLAQTIAIGALLAMVATGCWHRYAMSRRRARRP